jgi:hypothetical protein
MQASPLLGGGALWGVHQCTRSSRIATWSRTSIRAVCESRCRHFIGRRGCKTSTARPARPALLGFRFPARLRERELGHDPEVTQRTNLASAWVCSGVCESGSDPIGTGTGPPTRALTVRMYLLTSITNADNTIHNTTAP